MFVTVRHIESIVVELALQLVPPAVALGKFSQYGQILSENAIYSRDNSNFDAPPFSQDITSILIHTNYRSKDVSRIS